MEGGGQTPTHAEEMSGLYNLMEEDEAEEVEEAREQVDHDARTAEALTSGDTAEVERRRHTAAKQRTGAARKVRQIQHAAVAVSQLVRSGRTGGCHVD